MKKRRSWTRSDGLKLNPAKARTIRRLRHERAWLHKEIAERYNISTSHSSNICVGRFWQDA